MRRFPDITVISWQCDCNAYLSFSIDLSRCTATHTCYECGQAYSLTIDDIIMNVDVDPVSTEQAPFSDSTCTDVLTS